MRKILKIARHNRTRPAPIIIKQSMAAACLAAVEAEEALLQIYALQVRLPARRHRVAYEWLV